MSAAGRVVVGFSKPYVALYKETTSDSTTTISYESGQILARGVDVSLSPESSDDNIFYADNEAAETDAGSFTGGTVSLTVDGLLKAAEALIMGTAKAGTDGWTAYDDDQKIPYVGIGWITKYMSDGVVSYVPTLLAKCSFKQIEASAKTQEESIDFQTQSLEASIFRSGDAKHTWKFIGADQTTESAAETALKTKLGIS